MQKISTVVAADLLAEDWRCCYCSTLPARFEYGGIFLCQIIGRGMGRVWVWALGFDRFVPFPWAGWPIGFFPEIGSPIGSTYLPLLKTKNKKTQ